MWLDVLNVLFTLWDIKDIIYHIRFVYEYIVDWSEKVFHFHSPIKALRTVDVVLGRKINMYVYTFRIHLIECYLKKDLGKI